MRKSKEMSENFAKTVFLTVSDVIIAVFRMRKSAQFENFAFLCRQNGLKKQILSETKRSKCPFW